MEDYLDKYEEHCNVLDGIVKKVKFKEIGEQEGFEILSKDLCDFLVYIMDADETLKDEEIEFLDALGYVSRKREWTEYIKKNGIRERGFEERIPLSFRIAQKYEEQTKKKARKYSTLKILLELFEVYGAMLLQCNGVIPEIEYNRYQSYIRKLYEYVNSKSHIQETLVFDVDEAMKESGLVLAKTLDYSYDEVDCFRIGLEEGLEISEKEIEEDLSFFGPLSLAERVTYAQNDTICEICDYIDKLGLSASETSGKKLFKEELRSFLIYLSWSNGSISKEDASRVCQIVPIGRKTKSVKPEVLEEFSKTMEQQGVAFEKNIPYTFQSFINFDNRMFVKGIPAESGFLSRLLLATYMRIGALLIACNNGNNENAKQNYKLFLSNLHQYINNNNKYVQIGEENVPLELDEELELCTPEEDEDDSVDEVDDTDDGDGINIQITLSNPISNDNNSFHGITNTASAVIFEPDDDRKLEDLLEDLNGLVGLESVKNDVNSIVNLIKIRKIKEERGMKQIPMSLHLVFTGNPGTGKTTVARLLSKIYCKLGVLSRGHLVEVDRSGLVGGYVGQTALKVQDVIQKSLGGILFIDEAYSLTQHKSENDFGQEAVETLLKGMEDNRKDLIVIVAGYPDLMSGFLDSNPGLRSRFNKYIKFDDYSPEELRDIFMGLCEQNDVTIENDCLNHVHSFFDNRVREVKSNFANGRDVRNYFEKAMINQANRLAVLDHISDEDIKKLLLEDVADIVLE